MSTAGVPNEENPKDHDFDQRQDGPMPRKSIQIATDRAPRQSSDQQRQEQHRSVSDPNVINSTRSPSSVSSPTNGPARHSTQMDRNFDHPHRRSTQMSRGRASRDFDRRTDGPYGRPSLTMTRRKSDNIALPSSPDVAAAPENAIADEPKEGEDNQAPISLETLGSTDAAFEPEPPPLNYSLWPRKWSITIFWSFVIIDSVFMPIGLYFGLWYGTNLSPNTVFSIVTAALGGISILEYVLRFRRLWIHKSTCRVIGARRAYLDWFHWNFSLGWVIIMVELIVGTIPKHPPIRLLAMPLASMLYAFGTELLIVDIARYFHIPAPCRISSVPKGSQLRPGIYSIIEDVIAVDGGGNTEFREAFNRRYEASHVFRAMLRRAGVYWAVGAEACAVATTIMVFAIHNKDAAYTIGWSVPFVWAGIWTLGTIWYVKRKLREEKTAWAEEVAAKSNA